MVNNHQNIIERFKNTDNDINNIKKYLGLGDNNSSNGENTLISQIEKLISSNTYLTPENWNSYIDSQIEKGNVYSIIFTFNDNSGGGYKEINTNLIEKIIFPKEVLIVTNKTGYSNLSEFQSTEESYQPGGGGGVIINPDTGMPGRSMNTRDIRYNTNHNLYQKYNMDLFFSYQSMYGYDGFIGYPSEVDLNKKEKEFVSSINDPSNIFSRIEFVFDGDINDIQITRNRKYSSSNYKATLYRYIFNEYKYIHISKRYYKKTYALESIKEIK